jgi:hypothetical protein
LIGALLEPASSAYNGQGTVQPSVCLPLHADDFERQWLQLWSLHVKFGTSKSHKKLAKKAEKRVMAEDAAAYGMTTPAAPSAGIAKPSRPVQPLPRFANAIASGIVSEQRKRNYSQTKAASLLSGMASGTS